MFTRPFVLIVAGLSPGDPGGPLSITWRGQGVRLYGCTVGVGVTVGVPMMSGSPVRIGSAWMS